MSPERKAELIAKLNAYYKKKDAVLVAHYYTSHDLQALAEETGGCVSDSLEMACFGNQHPAKR